MAAKVRKKTEPYHIQSHKMTQTDKIDSISDKIDNASDKIDNFYAKEAPKTNCSN
jgi:hypothetical protein